MLILFYTYIRYNMHGGVHFFAESAPRKAMPKQYHFKSPGQSAWMEVDYLRENDVQRVAPRPSEYVPDDEPKIGRAHV